MSRAALATFRLVIVGVGGQGCVTAGRVVGEAAVAEGLDARVGEIHGLSQRGGSVQSTVVVGPGRTSRVDPGEADVLMALEPLEALRALPFASVRTRVLVNLGRIVPFLLTWQGARYPTVDEVLGPLGAAAADVTALDATALAEEAGSAAAANCVLLGALAALDALPFSAEALRAAVDRTSPPRHVETNRRAFASGHEAVAGRRRTA